MSKFHIDSSGNPGVCRATDRACPLGGEHFDKMGDAHVHVAHEEIASEYKQYLRGEQIAQQNSDQFDYVMSSLLS